MRYSILILRLVFITSLAFLAPSSSWASKLFQPAQTYGSGGVTALSIAVADINGDGKPDIVVANGCGLGPSCSIGAVAVLLGNGDGTFQAAKNFKSGLAFTSSVAVADVNGDGKPDLVLSTGVTCSPACAGMGSVLLGNGDGTFGTFHTFLTGGYEAGAVAIADVDGDDKLDILVSNAFENSNLSGHGSLGVLLGNGDGTFQAAQTYDTGDLAPNSLVLGKLNDNGKLDAVLVHPDGNLAVLMGNGDGSFQAAQIYRTGGALSYSVAIADINGDGKPDLIATGGTGSGESSEVGVLLGNGDGSFQPVVAFDTGAPFSSSVAVADVNGDGYPDLIVAHTCPTFCNASPITVLLGNGDGTFKAPQRYTSGGKNANAVVATDVNGDGKPDLLVANSCVSNADCSSGVVAALLGISGVKTSTKLGSSLNPAVYGQSVTITATVSSVGPSAPTGTVKFMNGSVSLGSAAVSGGVASLTKTNFAAGTLSITAIYSGDTNSAKSTSAPLVQNIDQATTMTAITSSVNPSTQGEAVKFTAHVTSATTHVTGSVTFTAGSAALGTVALSSGKATLTTSALPKGSNQTITATYGGTSNIVGSAGSVNQTVN